jgi:chromate transporter
MKKLKLLFEIFWVFFKIGAFTFGGGYAMIPLINRETVENKKWISDQDILDIVAIAESTPGPIAINSATFVGYKVAGTLGSVFATLGTVIPSFIIILLISFVLEEFQHLTVIKYAFEGIRAGVLALVLKAFWTMYKKAPKNLISYIISALAFILAAFVKLNILYCIIICALIGLTSSIIARRRMNK